MRKLLNKGGKKLVTKSCQMWENLQRDDTGEQQEKRRDMPQRAKKGQEEKNTKINMK